MATLQWQSTAPRSNVNKSPSETVNCESAQARVFWRKFVLRESSVKKAHCRKSWAHRGQDWFVLLHFSGWVCPWSWDTSSQCGDSKKIHLWYLNCEIWKVSISYQHSAHLNILSTSAPLLKWAGDRFDAIYYLSISHPSQLLLNISPISKIADGRW